MTCWRTAPADRVAVLIDAAAYYGALLEAFRQARGSILILGWDFDPAVRFDPTDPETELRRLLPALVKRRPELQVHVLIWDISVVFGPSSTANQLLDRAWHAHPRIHFRFDGRHPFGASHHEKLVCIDDALAFAGGIDLTVKHWDTPEHDPADPRRVDEQGERYDPVHDLQMAVSGSASTPSATWRSRGRTRAPGPRSPGSGTRCLPSTWPARPRTSGTRSLPAA